MELRHLRYFVAIGEVQHYGRAARSLRVAQPALSRQIQDLEEELGFKLFERLPRGVKLSAAGKLFLEDARRILQEGKRGDYARRPSGARSFRNAACRVLGKYVLAWRCSGFFPAIPRAATRCKTSTSTGGEFGAI